MNNLDILRQQLKKAGVSDDEMSRGVRLTTAGTAKLCRKLGVANDQLEALIRELARTVKQEIDPTGLPASPAICEDDTNVRFEYEADTLGNVMLRDSETGATKFIQGSEGAKLLREIERSHPEFQALIAPYFAEPLREFANAGRPAMGGGDAETGGTYNFPYRGNFACARFWLEGNTPKIEIISVVDDGGEEVPIDASQKADAERVAWTWVTKV